MGASYTLTENCRWNHAAVDRRTRHIEVAIGRRRATIAVVEEVDGCSVGAGSKRSEHVKSLRLTHRVRRERGLGAAGGTGGFAEPVPSGFSALDGSGSSGGTGPVTIGSGPDTLALQVSEDAWNGNAQFTVSVDGRQIGGTLTATASHAAGQTQIFNVLGTFAAGSHTATVNFLNDAYGGTPATDRNLYVTGATIDNSVVSGATLSEGSAGPATFHFHRPGPLVQDHLRRSRSAAGPIPWRCRFPRMRGTATPSSSSRSMASRSAAR